MPFLSNLEKILGKLMRNRAYDFLEKFKSINSLQFSLRQHHSISYTILNLTLKTKALVESNFS